jgi:hypothetical protein
LRVGFDSIDFGSFLAKAIPQMQGYRCCAWAIRFVANKKTNYWLLLPIQRTNGFGHAEINT